jgi:hypothetical protein
VIADRLPVPSTNGGRQHGLREIVQQAERVARAEVQLTLSRARDAAEIHARRVVGAAAAALLVGVGIVFSLIALFLALASRIEHWLAALLTACLAFAAAAIVHRGMRPRPHISSTHELRE